MKKLKKAKLMFVALTLTIFLLSACAVVTPEKKRFRETMQPPAGKSVIYFYRPFSLFFAEGAAIYENGKKIIPGTSPRTYSKYYIEPGTYTFEAKSFLGLHKKVPVTIVNKKPGKVYYVKIITRPAYIELKEMDPEQAKLELPKCFELKVE